MGVLEVLEGLLCGQVLVLLVELDVKAGGGRDGGDWWWCAGGGLSGFFEVWVRELVCELYLKQVVGDSVYAVCSFFSD